MSGHLDLLSGLRSFSDVPDNAGHRLAVCVLAFWPWLFAPTFGFEHISIVAVVLQTSMSPN